MVDISIVTAGAVINIQKGEVIAIMNQYAYIGKGKSIHSYGQMKFYKQIVHNKSHGCLILLEIQFGMAQFQAKGGFHYQDFFSLNIRTQRLEQEYPINSLNNYEFSCIDIYCFCFKFNLCVSLSSMYTMG